MKLRQKMQWFGIGLCALFLQACSSSSSGPTKELNRKPVLFPDYTSIEIPANIAPLNFVVEESGERFEVEITGQGEYSVKVKQRENRFCFDLSEWERLVMENKGQDLLYRVRCLKNGVWQQYQPFRNHISTASVDPYLYYRLIHPGYESWGHIQLLQRSLTNFEEHTLVDNSAIDGDCVNCHSFRSNNHCLFHVRGKNSGTYIKREEDWKRYHFKNESMKNGAVYPRWHPSGRFIAFSSNKVIQQFHSHDSKKIEVTDLESSLYLFDCEEECMVPMNLEWHKGLLDTYPEWSPDGTKLYFCRAQVGTEKPINARKVRYDLYQASFDSIKREFTTVELLQSCSAKGCSATFPRVSPDGNHLVYTQANYGCFPVWHHEADLYCIDLQSKTTKRLESNSSSTESYHSWSSQNGWMVFSSRQLDGQTSNPFFSFRKENGTWTKAFVLPQKDPEYYKKSLRSYNIPELSTADVCLSPKELRSLTQERVRKL